MNCTQSRKLIDELASGTASTMQQQALESHLEACQACQQHLNVTEKMILRAHELPVLDPQPGFEARMMGSLDKIDARKQKHTHWFAAGFGGAVAAGLMMVVALNMMVFNGPTTTDANQIQMAINESRTLNVVFNVPEDMTGVEMEIELTDGLELAELPGRNMVSWKANLKAGKNRLPVLVHASGSGSQTIIARMRKEGQQKEFRIEMNIEDSKLRTDSRDLNNIDTIQNANILA